jgi:hypothetical protein
MAGLVTIRGCETGRKASSAKLAEVLRYENRRFGQQRIAGERRRESINPAFGRARTK